MAKTPETPAPSDDAKTDAVGKGRPTPTRAEREAQRKRPLVDNSKEARQRARRELQAERDRARAGLAAGEERYLPARDKGPQRKFVRDLVDSQWHIGEWVMPAMIVVLLTTFIPSQAVQYWAFIGLWMFIFFVIGDMLLTSVWVKRAARKKFGDKMESGLGRYGAFRVIQMRFMRQPKPQVRRGGKPI